MKEQTLLDLVLHGAEERNLEYKSSMHWDDVETKSKVTRTVMSMANIKDGGVLVFGVEEHERGSFLAAGMRPEEAASFNQDDVMTSVNKYADPYIDLKVEHLDYRGMIFVVIQVKEFEEIPIVCKKSGVHLRRGEIYTRSRRKNESAPVSSQTEMREILEMSFDKRMRRYREQFFRWGMVQIVGADQIAAEQFERERERIRLPKTCRRIMRGPFWQVVIRPLVYDENHFQRLPEIQELLENCAVRLRDQGFPCLPGSETNGDHWVTGCCEGREPGLQKECWWFLQSGQFLQYRMLRDFHREGKLEPRIQEMVERYDEAKGFISVLSILFMVTEIFEFAIRLAEKNALATDIHIEVALKSIEGYQLFYWNPRRELPGDYRAAVPEIERECSLSLEELLARGHEEALKTAQYILERFNWNMPPKSLLQEEQRKFLERTL